MPQSCVARPTPAPAREHRGTLYQRGRAWSWRGGGVGPSGVRGCGAIRGLAVRALPPPSSPRRQAGFSGNRVAFIYRDFEWPDHSVIAAPLAPGSSWEIAWDGSYLWKGNWDSHPAHPEQSPHPQPRTHSQRGACVKFPIRHTNLQAAESIEASSFFTILFCFFFFFLNLKAQNRLHVVLSEVSPWLALK